MSIPSFPHGPLIDPFKEAFKVYSLIKGVLGSLGSSVVSASRRLLAKSPGLGIEP